VGAGEGAWWGGYPWARWVLAGEGACWSGGLPRRAPGEVCAWVLVRWGLTEVGVRGVGAQGEDPWWGMPTGMGAAEVVVREGGCKGWMPMGLGAHGGEHL